MLFDPIQSYDHKIEIKPYFFTVYSVALCSFLTDTGCYVGLLLRRIIITVWRMTCEAVHFFWRMG